MQTLLLRRCDVFVLIFSKIVLSCLIIVPHPPFPVSPRPAASRRAIANGGAEVAGEVKEEACSWRLGVGGCVRSNGRE